jgi:microtubule-associated protein-like 1/2
MQGSLADDNIVELSQGHNNDVSAMVAHPAEDRFATLGSDMVVIQWNAATHQTIWRTQLDKPCKSIAYDLTGQLIAVGTYSGLVILLDSATGEDVITSVDIGNDEPVNALAFSPDGKFLAAGSRDRCVYIYVTNELAKIERYNNCQLQGHNSAVVSIDWSSDSQYLRSTSTNYELLFWDVPAMASVTGKQTRDLEWNTQTCIVGFHTLGAWSNLDQDEDITVMAASGAKELLAVGSSQGTVSLYRYPCSMERPQRHVYKACSGDVTSVHFTATDKFMVVVGGGSNVFQWSLRGGATDAAVELSRDSTRGVSDVNSLSA